MKLSNIAFLAFLTLLLPSSLTACSCAGIVSFCETAAWNLKVVEVKILEKYRDPYSFKKYIDIEVMETLLDESRDTDLLMTIVESGSSCDIGVFDWASVGESYVMTFDQLITYKKPKYPGLAFSLCSINFLKIENGFVSGFITRTDNPEGERIRYSTFKNTINNLCLSENTLDGNISINSLIEDGYLTVKNFDNTKVAYNIFDVSGKLFLLGSVEAQEIENIFLFDLPSGIYLIHFRNQRDQITKKFVLI